MIGQLTGLTAMFSAVLTTAVAAPLDVSRIEITGTDIVSVEDVENELSPYVDRPLTVDDLQSLADDLSRACQSRGSLLCRAQIPRQNFDTGALKVQFVEGRFTRIDAPDDIQRIVENVFKNVLNENSVSRKAFYEAVALLDDVPGLTVTKISPVRLQGADYALVVDGSYKRIGVRGLVTNRGSRREKPYKANLSADIGSVIMLGDELGVSVLTRPEALDELFFIKAQYTSAPFVRGLKFYSLIEASNTSPRSILENRNVSGELIRSTVGGTLPLWRREGFRVDLDIRFEHSDSQEEEDGQILYEDRLTVGRAALNLRRRSPKSLLTARFEASQGISLFSPSGGSRADGQTTFTKALVEARYTRQFFNRVLLRLGVAGQAADSSLLFSEEFGIGGGDYGRAYDFGEVLGEYGLAGFYEVGLPIRMNGLIKQIEPTVFFDTGATWNYGNNGLTDQSGNPLDADLVADGKWLSSAGAGLSILTKGNFRVDYEAAVPLSDAPYTLQDDYVRHRIDLNWAY